MKIWWKSVARMRAISARTLRWNERVMLQRQEGSCVAGVWLVGVKTVDFGAPLTTEGSHWKQGKGNTKFGL